MTENTVWGKLVCRYRSYVTLYSIKAEPRANLLPPYCSLVNYFPCQKIVEAHFWVCHSAESWSFLVFASYTTHQRFQLHYAMLWCVLGRRDPPSHADAQILSIQRWGTNQGLINEYLKFKDEHFLLLICQIMAAQSQNQENTFGRVTRAHTEAFNESTENGDDNGLSNGWRNPPNNNKTERLERILWIPLKEVDFLRKPNPSWAECRLNWRCLQSKEIPMMDSIPAAWERGNWAHADTAEPWSPEARVSWRPSSWRVLTTRGLPSTGRSCDHTWAKVRARTFPSFLLYFIYLEVKHQPRPCV